MPNEILLTALEWAGSFVGLTGAWLLASNTRLSRWGWVAFLGSNVLLVALAVGLQRWGLLVMQLGFLCSSILGIARSFRVAPPSAPAGEDHILLSAEKIELKLEIEKDGQLRRSSVAYDARGLTYNMVEQWLAARNLVVQPAGVDFRYAPAARIDSRGGTK